jgi:hypothetical protein
MPLDGGNLDLEKLRRQYEMLNDEALLEINRNELVDAAREVYDAELQARGLRAERHFEPLAGADELPDLEAQGEAPGWLEDAIAVMSIAQTPGSNPADQMADARIALDQTRIPNYLTIREPAEHGDNALFELMVPAAQHLNALSVLDQRIFNPRMEEDWKAHFATMSDDELMELDAEDLVAGLRDRIDRLVRAYEDELLKRGLAELESEA